MRVSNLRSTIGRLALVLSTLAGVPGCVMAQGGEAQIPPVNIPSHHWVYPLLDRMAADGLLDGEWLPGRRPVGGDVVGTALDSAVVRAERDAPVWLETARAARRWLREEYGIRPGRGFRLLPTAGGRLGDGPLTDPSAVLGGVEAVYRPAGNVGLWAAPTVGLGGDGVELPTPRVGVAWSPGPIRISAHYGPHRLGLGGSGGIVLNDAARMPWVELALDEPTYLPWLLRILGPFQISASASRIGADSLGPGVVFFSGEFRINPFPWVTAELSRTAVVAAQAEGKRITFHDLLGSFLGTRSGTTANFDDQKASMGYFFRFRIAGLAVNPYAIWGWEDTWQIDQDPGTILGLWLPAIPVNGRPVGFRYEYTAFGDAGRIIWPWSKLWDWRNWYRHLNRARYVNDAGVPLGHPLGGYGTEHRIRVEVPVPGKGLLVTGDLYGRNRIAGTALQEKDQTVISYSNLLYDEVPGRSWGGRLSGVLAADRLHFGAAVEVEVGNAGWRRVAAGVEATWLLP